MCIAMYKVDSGNLLYSSELSLGALCGDLDEWDGRSRGYQEGQEGVDVCIHIADSLHYTKKLTQHHKAGILH